MGAARFQSGRGRRFGEAAHSYVLGRAVYPTSVLHEMLSPDARDILDLGGGNGQVSAGLRSLGLRPVCVDIDIRMLKAAPQTFARIAAAAEALPFAAETFDAVVSGQSFHWFEPGRTVSELRRIVRPGGCAHLIEVLFDDSVPWIADVCDVYRPHERTRGRDIETIARAEPVLGEPYTSFSRTIDLPATESSVLARVASSSLLITAPAQQRAALLEAARRAIPPGIASVRYRFDVRSFDLGV